MERQKRVAAIHDISGFGRCSLTVALPILSAAGIETSVMPTAVLSTHTGGIPGYTFRDLTPDLESFMAHWKSIDLRFDAIYSGYLGSFEQLALMHRFLDLFATQDNLTVIDPVMGDNGKFYASFTETFARGMSRLCARADIVVPNMTEAALMTGQPYREGPYTRDYVKEMMQRVSLLGPRHVVLTGVGFREGELGAAVYDRERDACGYAFGPKIEGEYHGTGDVFASALTAALVNGFDLLRAAEIAVHFTTESIELTKEAGTDRRFGVDFEQSLPILMGDLGLI